MLKPSAFLILLQSFLRQRLASAFPAAWIPDDEFGRKMSWEFCGHATWQEVTADLKKMLLLRDRSISRNVRIEDWCRAIWEEWSAGERKIAFQTSGSTGIPKICVHSIKDLDEEVDFLKTLLGDCKYFVSAVSPHHLYGFTFGLYLPIFLNAECIRIPPFPHIFRTKLRLHGVGIGFPDLYGRFGDNLNGEGTLLSASAPLASTCMQHLLDMNYRVVDIFGSSETGVLGIRRTPHAWYELLPYYEKAGEDSVQRGKRLIELADHFEWRGNREFRPVGRIDRMVQVAGINVSPMKVAARIQMCDLVRDCTVRLMRPEEGYRLKAFVVPANKVSAKDVAFALRQILQELPAEERPTSITIGDVLPRNTLGKICDW